MVVEKAEPHIQNLNGYKYIQKGIRGEAEMRSSVFYENEIKHEAQKSIECMHSIHSKEDEENCEKKQIAFCELIANKLLKEILPKYLEKDGEVEGKIRTQARADLRWIRFKEPSEKCGWDVYEMLTSKPYKELFIKVEDCLKNVSQNPDLGDHYCDKEWEEEKGYAETELNKIAERCGGFKEKTY